MLYTAPSPSAGRALWRSQNFLRSDSVARDLVRRAGPGRDDLVLEIGPGRGIITRQLARVCSRVIAVEYDRALCDELARSLRDLTNVEVVWADFRHYDLPRRDYKVVASIPFAITADIMAKLTAGRHAPTEAHLVMQAEAARRYAGRPYDRESLKSLLLKPGFELSVVHAFRRTDFSPAPHADTVLLRMQKRDQPLLPAAEARAFRDLLCFAFAQRGADIAARLDRVFTRPQLNRLALAHGFPLSARIVDLTFAQWLGLFRYHYATASTREAIAGAERRLLRRQHGLTKIHRSRSAAEWQRGCAR